MTEKRGLQKFTDFESITTPEAFIELRRKSKPKAKDLFYYLQDKLNEAIQKTPPIPGEVDKYFDRLHMIMEHMKLGHTPQRKEEIIETYKRDRWYVNEAKIKYYIHEILTGKKYLPSNTEIAQATGLSRVTVDKHIKENGANLYKADEIDKYKMLNSQALNQLYQIGIMDRNVKALKAFIEYTKDSTPPQVTSMTTTNYIQINSLILSQEAINSLNPSQLEIIEGIFKKALRE